VVKEPVRVLYITSGALDIEKAQEIRRQAARPSDEAA
jgi:hypothetical protein